MELRSAFARRALVVAAFAATVVLIATLVGRGPEREEPAAGPADPPSTTSTTTETTTSTSSTTPSTTTTTTTATTTTTTTVPPQLATIHDMVRSMTSRELALQLIVSGAPGATIATTIEQDAGSVCLGGVFVKDDEGNFAGSGFDAARSSIMAIISAAGACPARPLIVTDAELGSVLRVPVTPVEAPSTFLAVYETGRTAEALESLYDATSGLATELDEIGVDVSLGIVADVDVDPGYYMATGNRTFGGDPVTVGEMVGRMVDAYCEAGVGAALKHFPNQGATPADPHGALSVSVNTVDQWRGFGRLPYAGNLGAPIVLTGHIIYDDVDPGAPASLSRELTSGLLRDELGFGGVIITDDLHGMAGARLGESDAATRAVAAVEAGADLTLWVDSAEVGTIVDALTSKIDADASFRQRVHESVGRVLRLKAALGVLEQVPADGFDLCPPGDAIFLPDSPKEDPSTG